ncbi:V-type ATP synthase subunit D [Rhodococcus sp. BE178]|uniref:V-type ATP synthase subunit D n=1 Tax=Rhodococcus sp. BE178 TaxID=2817737 RepID=UPI003D1C3AC3
MTRMGHVPPGRTGRLWLERRLEVARRGVDLLDRKRQVLLAEGERLERVAADTATAWQDTCREADAWLVRVLLLGGERAIRLGTGETAQVDIEWARSMGVRYPASATVTTPAEPLRDDPLDGPAVFDARRSHRAALEAAVRHAAALAAVRTVRAEERTTARRMRALSQRWIPALEDELRRLRLELEEQEHADAVRRRWVMDRRTADGPRQPEAGT